MSIYTYLDKVKAKNTDELTSDDWKIHWAIHGLNYDLPPERLRRDEQFINQRREFLNIIKTKQYRLLPEHFMNHRNEGSYIGDDYTDEECMLEAIFILARRLDIYTKILRTIPKIIKKNKGMQMTDEQMRGKILETLKGPFYPSWILGDHWDNNVTDSIDDYKQLIDYPRGLLGKQKRKK